MRPRSRPSPSGGSFRRRSKRHGPIQAQKILSAPRGADVVFEAVANSAIGDYPDGGCVVEVYSNAGLGYSEIETLSPELALEPGTVLENVLRIQLATTDAPLAPCPLADAVRALAAPHP